METDLRHRKHKTKQSNTYDHSTEAYSNQTDEESKKKLKSHDSALEHSYWLTRIVFLRSLAFIYFVAFLVALHQNKELLGSYGLLPTDQYLALIKNHFSQNNMLQTYVNIPTLLLFINESEINFWLDAVAYAGLILSGFVLLVGSANMLIMTVLWLLYHSLVNIGQRWYSFGWESQLLETGFLAIFFCPLLSLSRFSVKPSRVVIWGYRWLILRIMIGAGLIKIRGDQCWRDLTCMNYHYETQPVPNPLSYYLHQSPELFHKFETLSNHFIELIAPWFILLTRKMCIVGGVLQIFFQVVLIISGNLSFLNWLTILPSIACFDDKSLASMFNRATVSRVQNLNLMEKLKSRRNWSECVRSVLDFVLAVLILALSVPVVQNLLSSKQAMNTSFDSFRLVNTYGAFGSITKERTEVILQGTRNKTIVPNGIWQEYEFKCKPGDISRRPCVISPYHYRLDWLMWFAAFMNYQQNPWLLHLSAKLLVNDRNISSLISKNPFLDRDPPRFIRGEHYLYQYTKVNEGSPNWWQRKRVGEYFPPVDLHSVASFLRAHRWKVPKKKN